jgi:stage II sporulation protein R
MKTAKKALYFGIAALLALLPALRILSQPSSAQAYSLLSENAVRLHILADSDSEGDQALKLEVRDYILQRYASVFSAPPSKERALEEAQKALPEMERSLNAFLAEKGAAYRAALEVGRSFFPDREYEGVKFPQGDYDCVRVLLGSATGRNWWCVLYPPLCFFEAAGEEGAGAGQGVEVRWRVKEWWEALKNENREGDENSPAPPIEAAR